MIFKALWLALLAFQTTAVAADSLSELCQRSLKALPGKAEEKALATACDQVMALDGCTSVKGTPIFHFDHKAADPNAKRILTFALIHGDEGPAGSVARSWMERLTKIEPRNSWRIVPVLNPDGLKQKSRTNANGIDLNRNFPTKDWDSAAKKYWEKYGKKDPRRFPGNEAASEAETKCAIKHIENFKPSFIISIHTPYAVLDFDGPEIKLPRFRELPWVSMGNYPGSLGRYMWVDNKQPVLTVELKGEGVAERLDMFDQLQDLTGDMAIQSEKKIRESAKRPTEKAAEKKK